MINTEDPRTTTNCDQAVKENNEPKNEQVCLGCLERDKDAAVLIAAACLAVAIAEQAEVAETAEEIHSLSVSLAGIHLIDG